MIVCHWSRNLKIVEMLKLLIKEGGEVNQNNEDGNNSLMLICEKSYSDKILSVVELLIAEGVDVHRKNNQGKTAVDLLNERPLDEVPNRSQILAIIQKVY